VDTFNGNGNPLLSQIQQSAINDSVTTALRSFAENSHRKLGQVAQPLRAALTGSTTSPGIDATLAALGRDKALARIAAVTA
jgi:glutamyl-tRNA synthetase